MISIAASSYLGSQIKDVDGGVGDNERIDLQICEILITIHSVQA